MKTAGDEPPSSRQPCRRTDFFSIAMNKFLKKRVADGPTANDDALQALSQPPSPALKKSSASRWKKSSSKKHPETKPQLDLSCALPSSDDFRTSLIMPSLSTRFSMLREQDDPLSKMGKASDDSVLQPRRKSRMAELGYGSSPLFDIAEVSSINGSVRPQLPYNSRQPSFVSEEGYGSEADAQPSSVMSRSRPGEGNNLFGGRQKIYKIPTTGANSNRGVGRLVYDDDVGMSAFQKYKVRERTADESQLPRPSDESQGFDFGLDQVGPGSRDDGLAGLDTLPNDSAKDLSHSPSLSSYDKKRSTTSSTARSDARSSTAATSIASQPAVSAQPSPAQASANTAMTNGGATTPSAPSPIPSTSTMLDRSNTKGRRLYEQGLDLHMQEQQTSAMSRLNSIQRQRGMSVKTQQPYLHNTKSAGNLHERAPVYASRTQSPPLSSPLPPLNTSVRSASSTSSPAMGGQQSPMESHWDDTNDVLTQALEPRDRGKATAMGAFNKPAQAFDEQQYLERQKALQRSNSSAIMKTKAAAAEQRRLNRYEFEQEPALPSPPVQSQPAEAAHEPSKAYNVFQKAIDQYPGDAPTTTVASAKRSPLPDTHRTFFGNISASEDEDDEEDEANGYQSFRQPEYGYYNTYGGWQPTQLQSVSEHPAVRSEKSKASLAEESDNFDSLKPPQSYNREISLVQTKPLQDIDSPTLGPAAQPLNGMVHHLRQASNHSSLYAADDFALEEYEVPEVPEVPWNSSKSGSFGHGVNSTSDIRSVRESSYAVSNPWDLDEQSIAGAPTTGHNSTLSPIDDIPTIDIRQSRQSQISLVQDGVSQHRRPTLVQEESEISLTQDDLPSWQQELRKQHNRDASTATQQEREAFANELAARRAAIQENMKKRDANSRGTSPAPGPLRALGSLRPKTSRESVARAHDASAGGRSGVSSPRAPQLPTAQHPAFKAEGPGPSSGPLREMDPIQAERMLASSQGSRSRSNSAKATGRSRSRTGPYRDDLEKAMIEGHGSSAAAHTPPEATPFPSTSPEIMFKEFEPEHEKTSNYFGQASLVPNGAPAPNGYTPGRPVPVANPFSQNATPPLSGSSPSLASSTYSPIIPSSARPGGGLRKKTISKHEISEPTLLSSTSNVDTVDLPPGASLKNGMEDPPPIPPINPRRRATRKLFGRRRSNSPGEHEPRTTVSDPNLLLGNTSPKRDYTFPPSAVVRIPTSDGYVDRPVVQQQGFNPSSSPERDTRSAGGVHRSTTAPLHGGMF